METAIKTIIDAIKANDVDLDAAWLDKLVRSRNRCLLYTSDAADE